MRGRSHGPAGIFNVMSMDATSWVIPTRTGHPDHGRRGDRRHQQHGPLLGDQRQFRGRRPPTPREATSGILPTDPTQLHLISTPAPPFRRGPQLLLPGPGKRRLTYRRPAVLPQPGDHQQLQPHPAPELEVFDCGVDGQIPRAISLPGASIPAG